MGRERKQEGESHASTASILAFPVETGYTEPIARRPEMIVIRIVGKALEKARKSPRLVPVTRMVTRDGATFPQTVWVLPECAK